MTEPCDNSRVWRWHELRNPEDGRRTSVALSRECLDEHIFPKHLRSGNQPWDSLLGNDLAGALRRHYSRPAAEASGLGEMLEEASSRLEGQVRAGLEHPMVVIYSAGPTESGALQQSNSTWCVLTPAGAEAYVRAGWICTTYFSTAVSRWASGWDRKAQVRLAAMALLTIALGPRLPSGVIDVGLPGAHHRYRANLRLESKQNWAGMKMPRLSETRG